MKIRRLTNDRIQITHYAEDLGDGYFAFSLWDEEYVVGQRGILFITKGPAGNESASLIPDNGEGISGNLDSHVCRYHGWRGTTNGFSVTASGLREVVSARKTRRTRVYTLSADLAPELA